MIGVRTTTTATGEVAKFVTCKKCGHGYGYWLRRAAAGELAERLRTGHDPVPCPACGHYPKRMIEAAREEKFGWVFLAGILAGVLAGGGCFLVGAAVAALGGRDRAADWVSRTALGLMCPTAVCIPAAAYGLKALLAHKYDPNADPVDERIDRGRERAMSPAEYARLAPKPRRRDDAEPPPDAPPPIPFAPDD